MLANQSILKTVQLKFGIDRAGVLRVAHDGMLACVRAALTPQHSCTQQHEQ